MRESEAAPLSVLPENNQGMVFNPIEQAAMVAGRRGAALAPVTSLNTMLAQSYGGLDNIIAAATRSYQAIAGVKGAKAQAARQNLEDLLGIADKQRQQGQSQLEQSNWEKTFGENQRQFGLEYELNKQRESRLTNVLNEEKKVEENERGRKATDKAVQALMETLTDPENADENPKSVAWEWIHEFEPSFGSAGIDAVALWDIYNKIPNKSIKSQEGGFHPIQGIKDLIGGIIR